MHAWIRGIEKIHARFSVYAGRKRTYVTVRFSKGASQTPRRMKIKTDRSHNVVLEMDPKQAAFPPIPLAGIRLKHILAPVDFSECSRKAEKNRPEDA